MRVDGMSIDSLCEAASFRRSMRSPFGRRCLRSRLSFTSTDAMADIANATAMRIGIDSAMCRCIEPARNEQAAA
jgi:hypothetical protein